MSKMNILSQETTEGDRRQEDEVRTKIDDLI